MWKLLMAAPLVVLAACADDGRSYPAIPDPPTNPMASDVMTKVADQPIVIATHGVLAVALPASIGWSGDATAGFAVEPSDADGWPNTGKPEYWIRATIAGTGSFEISTNLGMAVGSVESADLARVALVPADYRLDGQAAFALDVRRPAVQAELLDRRGRRLVDASVVLGEAGARQTDWDRVALGATAGRHTVAAQADSFDARDLAVDLVDHVDRTETVLDGALTCFHAYLGDVEVAQPWPEIAAPEPTAINCTRL
jgi:hypothetical protein